MAGSLRKSEVFAAKMAEARGKEVSNDFEDYGRNQSYASNSGYKPVPEDVPSIPGPEDEIEFDKEGRKDSANQPLKPKQNLQKEIENKPSCI